MKTFYKLLKIEFKLSIRDMNVPIFGILLPVIIAIIYGFIYQDKLPFENATYTILEGSFGSLSAIGICATGVMGLPLVISEYRHKKVLKRYKVTPISPLMLLLVQVIVNFIMATLSMLIILLVMTIGFKVSIQGSFLLFILTFIFVSIVIYSIGMAVSAISKNSNQASLISVIIYFPMLIFSGATIPYENLPNVLQKFSDFLPLTPGIKLLNQVFLGESIIDLQMSIILMIVVTLVCIFLSLKFFKWD